MKFVRVPILFTLAILFSLASCSKKPVASFEFDQNNVKPPVTINFTNTSVNAEEFLWNFGDGITATEENPSHEYTKGGDYEVSLKVYGEDDTNTTIKTLTLLPNITGHWIVTFAIGPTNYRANLNLLENSSGNLEGEFALDDRNYSNISAESYLDGLEISITTDFSRRDEITFTGTVNSTYDYMSGEFAFRSTPGSWSATKL